MAFGKAKPAQPGDVAAAKVKQVSVEQAERNASGAVTNVIVGTIFAVSVLAFAGVVTLKLLPTRALDKAMGTDKIATVETAEDMAKVRKMQAAQRKFIVAKTGKTSCKDFTEEELAQGRARHFKRVQNGSKNPLGLMLAGSSASGMRDMMALMCAESALSAPMRHASGRPLTRAERDIQRRREKRETRRQWKERVRLERQARRNGRTPQVPAR